MAEAKEREDEPISAAAPAGVTPEQNEGLLRALVDKVRQQSVGISALHRKRVILNFLGSGAAYEVDVDHIRPVSFDGRFLGVKGLRVSGVEIIPRPRIFQSYSEYIYIPSAIIRAPIGYFLNLEATGLKTTEVTENYVVYVAEPSPLGWLFVLMEQSDLLSLARTGKEIAVARAIIEEMDELLRKAIRLSIAGKSVSELRAVPSPIRIAEDDYRDYIKEQLKRWGVIER